MSSNTLQSPPEKKKKRTLLFSLSFCVSVCVHLAILFLIGSVVLIQGVIPSESFMAYDFVGEGKMDPPLVPEEESSPMENPEPTSDPFPGSALESSSIEPPASAPEIIQSAAANLPLFTPIQGSPLGVGAGSAWPGQGWGLAAGGEGGGKRPMASLFGSRGAAADALVGYFYDLKQTSDGKPSGMALNAVESSKGFASGWREYKETQEYEEVVKKFVQRWDETVLSRYFRAPESLSTYQIFFPKMLANAAPKAFEVENTVKPLRWLVHYKGSVTSPVTGEIRFVGFGDDILFVRFNRKGVLEACLRPMGTDFNEKKQDDLGPEYGGGFRLAGGSWIKVKAGETYPMEVLIGESPGGDFRCFLMVQEKGKTYPLRPGSNAPLLPVFQTGPTTLPSYHPEQNGPAVAAEPLVFRQSP